MNELIFLVEEAPEGGYTARALGQSIFTEAETLEELRGNVLEAVQCHYDDGKAPPYSLPPLTSRKKLNGRTFTTDKK